MIDGSILTECGVIAEHRMAAAIFGAWKEMGEKIRNARDLMRKLFEWYPCPIFFLTNRHVKSDFFPFTLYCESFFPRFFWTGFAWPKINSTGVFTSGGVTFHRPSSMVG